jgi:gas vesicle protein
MEKKNQLWKGMLLGAIAGGALSLLDKETREIVKENVQSAARKVTYVVRNPREVVSKVKETAGRLMDTVEQVSEDISFITEKVDELRELTPQVTGILKETKEAFVSTDEEDLLDEDLL